MIYLTTPGTPAVRMLMREDDRLGAMLATREGRSAGSVAGITCALDNDCYGGRFDPGRWRAHLERHALRTDVLFAVAPDVLADPVGTRALFDQYGDVPRALGLPVAYVAQDGVDPAGVPWDQVDVLFVGGTIGWKWSQAAWAIARTARERGLRTHLGRANSGRRLAAAAPVYDSADGTFLAFGPDTNTRRLLAWLDAIDHQPSLPFG